MGTLLVEITLGDTIGATISRNKLLSFHWAMESNKTTYSPKVQRSSHRAFRLNYGMERRPYSAWIEKHLGISQ